MSEAAAAGTRLARVWIAAATVVTVLLAGTVALWAHYGTVVFYEIILSGLAACL